MKYLFILSAFAFTIVCLYAPARALATRPSAPVIIKCWNVDRLQESIPSRSWSYSVGAWVDGDGHVFRPSPGSACYSAPQP